MAKRKRESDDVEVSEVESASARATVHGIITELSPVKSSRKNESIKYFNAKISDGKKSMRVVSYSPGIRNDLEESRVNTAPISLVNCQIKETPSQFQSADKLSQDNRFEIIASGYCTVKKSPNTFSLPDDFKPLQGTSPDLKLDDLNAMPVDQNVTITIKILEMKPPVTFTTRNL